MKVNPKIYRLMCIFCWFGTALSVFLMAYMLHLVRSFPEVETFARNTRAAGGLVLIWLLVSVYFTVRMRKETRKK